MDMVDNKKDGVLSFTNTALFKQFKEFLDENDIDYQCSATKFGVNLNLAKISGISSETKHNARTKSSDVKAIR
jgi:membrane-bound inhibitor of C-type lysozyme